MLIDLSTGTESWASALQIAWECGQGLSFIYPKLYHRRMYQSPTTLIDKESLKGNTYFIIFGFNWKLASQIMNGSRCGGLKQYTIVFSAM